MHEATIARKLFIEALDMAFRLGIDRISCIKIKLGIASGIDKDTLTHSLIDHVFPETIAEDAEVEIVVEPLIARCTKCQRLITQVSEGGGCPDCGSKDLDVVGGTKVVVEGIY